MRTKLIFAMMGVITVVYSIVVILHMVLFRDRDVFFRYARSWSKALCWASGVKVTTVGAENLEPGKRYVYASTHNSLYDIPVLLVGIPDNIRMMYKIELEKAPIFGWALKMSPFIAVNRERSREASGTLDDVVETMSSGQSVLVFPEGTRSTTGKLGPFRRGAIAIAVRSQTDITPVVLRGTADIYPHGAKTIVPGPVTCEILKPLSVNGIDSPAGEKALVNELRNVILERLDSSHEA